MITLSFIPEFEHVQILENICRLCGKFTKPQERTDKYKYSVELRQHYDIDVNSDQSAIHPKTLCNPCRCYLYRRRSNQPTKRKIEARIFTPHSSDCDICPKNTGTRTNSLNPVEEVVNLFLNLNHIQQEESFLKIIKHLPDNLKFKDHVRNTMEKYPYNKLEVMQSLDLEEYATNLDQTLISTLLAYTGQKRETCKLQHLIPLIESIYRLSDPNFIGIWSFLQNLVTFSNTKSKQACNILGTVIPASKYSTISSFLGELEGGKEAKCPDGDVVFMFDNEQVIGKTWNVTANNKVKMSIITNIAAVNLGNTQYLQGKEDLHPKNWLSSENKEDLVSSLCLQNLSEVENGDVRHYIDNTTRTHYAELYHQLDNAIQQVQTEIQIDENVGMVGCGDDFIDKRIQDLESAKIFKKCPNCGHQMEKRKRKCIQCHVNISSFPTSEETQVNSENKQQNIHAFHMHKPRNRNSEKKVTQQYSHVKSFHSGQPYEVILLDPVFVNPNSIESMILVLRHIGKKGNIEKYIHHQNARSSSFSHSKNCVRYWTFVCCDGLPHALVRRLVEEYFVCSVCQKGCLGMKEAQHHGKNVHPEGETTFHREFDWVFLLTGDGHYEMNLMKSFMELNWNVMMKMFADVMGWKSEKAQQAALSCSDNHKTWQMLNIFHFGTMLELVQPYVVKCQNENVQATAEGFISYAKSSERCANFLYMFEMTCKYSQGIMNFRMGIRRNNPELLQAAKWMTKELFHGRNHPKYQEIEMYENFVSMILPPELKDYFKQHCSLSKSGHQSKGQGYDFILEEENKNVKGWLKRGVPTDVTWLATCRNHQALKTVKETVLSLSGYGSSETVDRTLKLEDAVDEWRIHLRQQGYLKDDKHGPILTSLSGEVLHQNLTNFTSEACRKRAYRMMDMVLHQTPPSDPTLQHPVYILESEKNKYEQMSALAIPDIDNKILDIIEIMDEKSKQAFLDLYRTMKRDKSNRKEQHITFLEEVSDAITEHMENSINTVFCNVEDDL